MELKTTYLGLPLKNPVMPGASPLVDQLDAHHGREIDTAGDGMEALARVERRVPDLVIVDLEMPRMNGVEFITRSSLLDRPPLIEVPGAGCCG